MPPGGYGELRHKSHPRGRAEEARDDVNEGGHGGVISGDSAVEHEVQLGAPFNDDRVMGKRGVEVHLKVQLDLGFSSGKPDALLMNS